MKVLLLVVENRDDIRTEYAKLLVRIAWNRWVSGIKFWEGLRRSVWYMRKTMVEEVLKDKKYKMVYHLCLIRG